MEPLLRGYGHQFDGVDGTFHHAESTAKALTTVYLCDAFLILPDGMDLATLNTISTSNAVLGFERSAVI
jgi:hypothetical protein